MAHSLSDLARDLGRLSVAFELARHEALEEACKIVEEEAKRVVGTYDYGWPQLQPETQKERVRLGFTANEPLLRTGEMRDTITHHIEGNVGYVGSPSKIALYQELGTSKNPPRSFLGGAAQAKEADIHTLGATALKKAITGALIP